MSSSLRPSAPLDRWAEWLVRSRFEGWPETEVRRVVRDLVSVRDAVLAGAALRADDVVLDVGTGTGLLAFGALAALGPEGRVLALDVSTDCLAEVAMIAAEQGAGERLRCLPGDAAALPLADGCVDAVLMRSVLMYMPLPVKAAAARECWRVLRDDGRFSLFEPVNRLNQPLHAVAGFGELGELGERAIRWEDERSVDAADPLVDFDHADLERCFVNAGFATVKVDLSRIAWSLPADAVVDGVLVPGRPSLADQWRAVFEPREVELLAAAVRRSGALVTRELAVLYMRGSKHAR